jgi:hypothetical protein
MVDEGPRWVYREDVLALTTISSFAVRERNPSTPLVRTFLVDDF